MTGSVQEVWLAAGETSFVVACESCLAARESLAARHAVVRGELAPGSDVGLCTCMRGHRVVVRRGEGTLAATA